MQLFGRERKKLLEALIDAFPSKQKLEMMSSLYLNRNLDATAGGSNLQEIVFKLIETAETEGWTKNLIDAACESNPGNIRLRDVAQKLLKGNNSDDHLNNERDYTRQKDLLQIGRWNKADQKPIDDVSSVFNNEKQYRLDPDPPIETKPPEVNKPLLERSVDYTRLYEFLAIGKLKEADQETVRILLEVADRQERGWLCSQDIKKLPCSVLREIDQLWFQHSNERFGFRVQRQIWVDSGGQPGEFTFTVFCKFGDDVGWRRNNDWLKKYDDFIFTLAAPKGHLPCLRFPGVENGTNCWKTWRESFEEFLSCVETYLSQ